MPYDCRTSGGRTWAGPCGVGGVEVVEASDADRLKFDCRQ
jgi:hypothetical protein